MASCVRQFVVVALSVLVMAPAAMAQDDPVKTMLNAPRKARQVAAEASGRAYKGDEGSPNGEAPVFSPQWKKSLEAEFKRIQSATGTQFSTSTPFSDMNAVMANTTKPVCSLDDLLAKVLPDPKGAGNKFIGRRVLVEGTVLSIKNGAVLVGDPADKMPHVAVVCMEGDSASAYQVGDHFRESAYYVVYASKHGEKQDMFLFSRVPGQIPAAARQQTSSTPMGASPASQPEEKGEFTDLLKGWRFVGVVHDDKGGVGVFVNKDGRKMYCHTGGKLDDGLYLDSLVDGQARMKVGKKQFDVYPW